MDNVNYENMDETGMSDSARDARNAFRALRAELKELLNKAHVRARVILTTAPDDMVLSVKDAALLLDRDPGYVYVLRSNGDLSGFRDDEGRVRFTADEIRDYLTYRDNR